MIPSDPPPWEAVDHRTQFRSKAGVFEAMVHDLRVILGRLAMRRTPQAGFLFHCSQIPGLTPLAALQAAIIHAVGFFQTTDDVDSLEAGKMAAAILLEAHVLADIRNPMRI